MSSINGAHPIMKIPANDTESHSHRRHTDLLPLVSNLSPGRRASASVRPPVCRLTDGGLGTTRAGH
jgi:hypothetical protein